MAERFERADMERYTKPVKIIRDPVHDYINLTRFDLTLIDTLPFQRLGDIRQLTCQHVYPAARHTRFEHSFGVLELMRSAVKNLNRNGILGRSGEEEPIIGQEEAFNASVAALLHDVGHCPFSHMGETQFDRKAVKERLLEAVTDRLGLKNPEDTSTYQQLLRRLEASDGNGAVHEQLSCIVLLEQYYGLLEPLVRKPGETGDGIFADFELMIRSILGIEYEMSPIQEEDRRNQRKNVVVRLLNSKIFDVDKLDYIMRDSYLTGIGTPKIDTKRLFRNMYLDEQYHLIFTSRAVPALQNMIDARDGLYMYVYNHHAVVYSDFLNTYISRKLSRSAGALLDAVRARNPKLPGDLGLEEAVRKSLAGKADQLAGLDLRAMGFVPKSYLFSVEAVVRDGRSDSQWQSLLREIDNYYRRQGGRRERTEEDQEEVRRKLALDIDRVLGSEKTKKTDPSEQAADLARRTYHTMQLVEQCLTRDYLKPWWKTVFELTSFMDHHFQDDRVHQRARKFICSGGDHGLDDAEMRSQIAKHVAYITRKLNKDYEKQQAGKENARTLGEQLHLVRALEEGEFFVVQRKTSFLTEENIERLEIALKNSEALGAPSDVTRQINGYYMKMLTNISPQKKYDSIYDKEGFYVFSKKPTEAELRDSVERETGKAPAPQDSQALTLAERRHHELLERILVFVVTKLVTLREQEFVAKFQTGPDIPAAEKTSMEQVYKDFLGQMGIELEEPEEEPPEDGGSEG